MDTYTLYAGQLLPFEESYAPKGHNACAGCGVALAVRHVYKALNGSGADLDKATWQIPWHQTQVIAADTARDDGAPALLSIAKPGGDGEAVLEICFDNELPGKKADPDTLFKKTPGIAAASGCTYVATASPSHPFDLIEKVRRAWDAAGSSFILILCPCPVAWGFEPENTVKLGRMAVETRLFPLYEIVGGYTTVTSEQPNARPVKDYLARQSRFSGLKGKKAAALQASVDAAFTALKEKARKGL